MNKSQLLHTLRTQNYNRHDLVKWIKELDDYFLHPSEYKEGDILFFYPFNHPFVILKDLPEHYIVVMLTSSVNCQDILEKCDSRFLNGSFFTTNLVRITKGFTYNYMGTYEDEWYLGVIYEKIKRLL